jgi:minor curlin subunit
MTLKQTLRTGTLITLIALFAAPALANGGHRISVEQWGHANSIGGGQSGFGQRLSVVQEGHGNVTVNTQDGRRNRTVVGQSGRFNRVDTDQRGAAG